MRGAALPPVAPAAARFDLPWHLGAHCNTVPISNVHGLQPLSRNGGVSARDIILMECIAGAGCKIMEGWGASSQCAREAYFMVGGGVAGTQVPWQALWFVMK